MTEKDLIEWLRESAIAEGRQAADLIATLPALRAEVERLTGERDRQYDQNAEQITRLAALEAENEKLRAALEGYACTCTGGECAEQAGYRDECGKPARAALSVAKQAIREECARKLEGRLLARYGYDKHGDVAAIRAMP